MDGVPLRVGTRGSALALVQARWVEAALTAADIPVELVLITTAGDVRAPDTAWGEGAFVTAIEAALLDGRIDAAVHSAKDVPTVEDPRLAIAAFTVREDPRDALVCRVRGTTLATLPPGARVGTDSPRRTAFLRAVRPDLVVHTLSGNVDTRLRKLDAGQSDALVLAVAGLTRLGHADRIDEVLPLEVALPAPGQGALALQVRAEDDRSRTAVASLDDPATRAAVEAERAFLRATGGGCRSPIGCLGTVDGDELFLVAAARRGAEGAIRPEVVRAESRGPVADRIALAEALAERIVRSRRPRVLLTRPVEQAGPLEDALRARGAEPVSVPTIAIAPVESGSAVDDRLSDLAVYHWVVVTSPNGARAVAEVLGRVGADSRRARWAAVGQGTADALRRAGIDVSFAPSRPLGAALAAELPLEPGARVLLARGDLADPALPVALAERGAAVHEVVAYETVEGPEASRSPLSLALLDGTFEALVFASGSAARGLLVLADPGLGEELRSTPAICAGPSTAVAVREAGFERVIEAAGPDPESLAEAVAATLVAGRRDRGTAGSDDGAVEAAIAATKGAR